MDVRTWSNQALKGSEARLPFCPSGVSPSEIWALFFAAVRDET